MSLARIFDILINENKTKLYYVTHVRQHRCCAQYLKPIHASVRILKFLPCVIIDFCICTACI